MQVNFLNDKGLFLLIEPYGPCTISPCLVLLAWLYKLTMSFTWLKLTSLLIGRTLFIITSYTYIELNALLFLTKEVHTYFLSCHNPLNLSTLLNYILKLIGCASIELCIIHTSRLPVLCKAKIIPLLNH